MKPRNILFILILFSLVACNKKNISKDYKVKRIDLFTYNELLYLSYEFSYNNNKLSRIEVKNEQEKYYLYEFSYNSSGKVSEIDVKFYQNGMYENANFDYYFRYQNNRLNEILRDTIVLYKINYENEQIKGYDYYDLGDFYPAVFEKDLNNNIHMVLSGITGDQLIGLFGDHYYDSSPNPFKNEAIEIRWWFHLNPQNLDIKNISEFCLGENNRIRTELKSDHSEQYQNFIYDFNKDGYPANIAYEYTHIFMDDTLHQDRIDKMFQIIYH